MTLKLTGLVNLTLLHLDIETALHEIICRTDAQRGEAFFWGVHAGAELDLLILKDGCRLGFEIKLMRSPSVTVSIRSSREALGLDHLYVVCHGEGEPWPLTEGISAVPATCLASTQWQPMKAGGLNATCKLEKE